VSYFKILGYLHCVIILLRFIFLIV